MKTLSGQVAALKSALAERNMAMTDAAAAFEAVQLQADEAAQRETDVREDRARQVALNAELQQKLTEVEAAWQAALREAEVATAEVTKLRGESGEV